jgi:hypothetical protein
VPGKKVNDVHDAEFLPFSQSPNLQPSNVSPIPIMHSSGGLRYEEASGAAWEGGRGAAVGAAKVIPSSSERRRKVLIKFSGEYIRPFLEGSDMPCLPFIED